MHRPLFLHGLLAQASLYWSQNWPSNPVLHLHTALPSDPVSHPSAFMQGFGVHAFLFSTQLGVSPVPMKNRLA